MQPEESSISSTSLFKQTMFQLIFAVILSVGFVVAGNDKAPAAIMSMKNEVSKDGHFNYAFDTSDGIHAAAAGDNHEAHGEVTYNSPEGAPIKLSYTADETGYHPRGAHLPTPPPMPPAIARALEYIKTHPKVKNDKQ